MSKSAAFVAALLLMGTPAQATVLGLYGSDCLLVDQLSAYVDIAFDGDSFKKVQTVYADLECHTPIYEVVYEGPYVLGEELGLIDYKVTSIRLAPLSESVTQKFISGELCGFSDWATAEGQNVAGLICGNTLIPPITVVYDRIQENKDGIQMGRATDELNGSSPEQRPTALDDVIYHAK